MRLKVRFKCTKRQISTYRIWVVDSTSGMRRLPTSKELGYLKRRIAGIRRKAEGVLDTLFVDVKIDKDNLGSTLMLEVLSGTRNIMPEEFDELIGWIALSGYKT